MKRRTFLKTLGGMYVLGASPLARARARSHRGDQVVVIGAGMAGLAAAGELRQSGFDVTVVEARERIGGRTNTDRSLRCAVDLGASWVHGVDGNPLVELAGASGCKLAATHYERLLPFDEDGSPLELGSMLGGQLQTDAMLGSVIDEAKKRESDISVKSIIDESTRPADWSAQQQRIYNFFLGAAEISDAANIDQISARYWDEFEGFSGGDRLVVNGYETMVRHMATELDIRTGVAVSEINRTGPRVRIETNQGPLEADRVVVTIPLGVLQTGKIKFSPALPDDKQTAIDRMGMGVFNKIALQFPKPFWPQGPHIIAHTAEERGKYPVFVNLYHYTGEPVLVCLVPPSFAGALEELSEAEARAGVMEVLRKMFGSDVPEPAAALQTRWQSDPWALGSYSFNKLGATGEDRERLAAPLDDRIFFAGEATHRTNYATVHGAYLSGIRAAREVAAAAS